VGSPPPPPPPQLHPGEVYELTGFRSSTMSAVARFQVTEGSGTGSAMKTEWLTVKDGKLCVGPSML
jgi:hypothetical protein